MWRFYTRGWGPRAWWYWLTTEGFPMWVAWRLPRRIALWTFIRVYGWDGQAPGPEYSRVYLAWIAGEAGRYKAPGPLDPPAGTQQQATYTGPPYHSALGYTDAQRREPGQRDLTDPRFEVLWSRLKHLEITGNDIAALLDELDACGPGAVQGPAFAEWPLDQLTVPVRVAWPDGRLIAGYEQLPEWEAAIAELRANPRFEDALAFEELPIPSSLGIERGWQAHRGGVSFRCLVMYVPFPKEGLPRFAGRVDVAYRRRPALT